jgi:hypothetical protein
MAGLAGLVAGVVQRAGGNLTYRGPAVVAVLPEALGHNEVAEHKKHREGDDEEKGKAEEMSCILGETHRVILVPFEFGPGGAGVARRDGGTTIRIGT